MGKNVEKRRKKKVQVAEAAGFNPPIYGAQVHEVTHPLGYSNRLGAAGKLIGGGQFVYRVHMRQNG